MMERTCDGDRVCITSAPTSSPTESPTDSPTESPTESPTDSPTTSPTLSPLPCPLVDAGSLVTSATGRNQDSCPAGNVFLEPFVNDDTNALRKTQQIGFVNQAPGTQIDVNADWSPLTTTDVLTLPYLDAMYVEAILIDTQIDGDSRQVRVACSFSDENFSPRVRNHVDNTCYVKVIDSNSTNEKTASCRAKSNGVPCIATIVFTEAEYNLVVGDLSVSYGLNTSYFNTLPEVTGFPSVQNVEKEYNSVPGNVPVENNFVVIVPSRALLPGEEFWVTIVARADTTINFAKFALDLTNSTLEYVSTAGTVDKTGAQTWDYSVADPDDGLLVCLLFCKPSPQEQPGNQANQEVARVQLRMSATADPGVCNEDIGLRVYEFAVGTNPEVPPGGQVIPAGGYVAGAVIGSSVSRNTNGCLNVQDDGPSGIIAQTTCGRGTYHNVARLTNTNEQFQIKTYAFYPTGTTLRDAATATCDCAGCGASGPASVDSDCEVSLTPSHVTGSEDLAVTVSFANLSATVHLRIFAPNVPLTVTAGTDMLGLISVGGTKLANICGDSAITTVTTTVTGTTYFQAGTRTTSEVDVTSLVKSQLSTSNSSIITVSTTDSTIRGNYNSDGSATVSFGALSSDITIQYSDTNTWNFAGLSVRHFQSVVIDETASEVGVELLPTGAMSRTRSEGKHTLMSWAEFTLASDPNMTYSRDISGLDPVSYEITDANGVAHTTVATITEVASGADFIEAIDSGDVQVHATWNPGCGVSSVEDFVCLSVQLPTATGATITDGNSGLSSVTMAYVNDSAFLSGTISKSFQQVGFTIEYPNYDDQWNLVSDPVTYVIADPTLAEVMPCDADASFNCVVPKIGVSGTTTLQATKGASTATIAITIVKANELVLTAIPYPYFTDTPTSVLRPLGEAVTPVNSNLYEKAQVKASLTFLPATISTISLAPSQTHVVVSSSDVSQVVVNVISGAFVAEVATSVNQNGLSTVTATFPGRDGVFGDTFIASYNLTVDKTTNPLVVIEDVSVVSSLQSRVVTDTLTGTESTVLYTVFGVQYQDGYTIPHTSVGIGDYDTEFLQGFTYTSNNAQALNISSDSGEIQLLENSLAASITVGSGIVNGSSDDYFVNLAGLATGQQFGVDLASSSDRLDNGYPVVMSSDNTTITVEIYLSIATGVQIGALEMALSFDVAGVSLNSVTAGTGLPEDFGYDVSSGEVEFGGLTSVPLEASNNHVATIVFDVLSPNAANEFTGSILSLTDASGGNDFPVPISFGVSGTASSNPSSRRVRRSKEATRSRRAPCGTDYPLGDVNGDCTFDTTDAFLLREFLLISGDAVAEQAFNSTKMGGGYITRPDYTVAMDVDFNGVVQVADVNMMM